MDNETFICIANRAWDSLWGESQKIMSRIAKRNRVLYFEPGRSVNRPLMAETRRNWPNFYRLHIREIFENLTIIQTPPVLPVGNRHLPRSISRLTVPLVAKINTKIVARQIRWALDHFAVKTAILWLYSPLLFDLVGKFNEKLSCYHNYDEFSDFVRNVRIKKLVQQHDNFLTSRVDVVFTTSRAQWRRRKAVNSNTYFVPNGVDFDLFYRALDPQLPLPGDINAVLRPIIGFAGITGDHIDVNLLLKVAKAYPECSMVLVGPDRFPKTSERNKLKALPNVFFLGAKELKELPNYLKAFDVALIPYLLVGHVLSGYPQKLHEYLAAGRSVVATAMPELKPFSQHIRIAGSTEEFIDLIREAMTDYIPETIQARVQVARENTWENRVEEMYRILKDHLTAGARTGTA